MDVLLRTCVACDKVFGCKTSYKAKVCKRCDYEGECAIQDMVSDATTGICDPCYATHRTITCH